MKLVTAFFVCLFLVAALGFAAAIDGKWLSERKMERQGQSTTIKTTFDLKSDGDKLTGTISTAFGDREPRSTEIKDGKIDGNKFSFTIVMSGPNGDTKLTYEGAVEGDTLKGTVTREGGQARPFEAKKT